MAKERRRGSVPAARKHPARTPQRSSPRPRRSSGIDGTAPTGRISLPDALSLYETALAALHQRDFASARERFTTLLSGFQEERELCERAEVYLRLCARRGGPAQTEPEPPASRDERLYAATLALNRGAADTAIDHAAPLVATNPGDDHAHYILAVAHALRSEIDESVAHLKRAIDLNHENRLRARHEPDFDRVRQHPTFAELVQSRNPDRSVPPRGPGSR